MLMFMNDYRTVSKTWRGSITNMSTLKLKKRCEDRKIRMCANIKKNILTYMEKNIGSWRGTDKTWFTGLLG